MNSFTQQPNIVSVSMLQLKLDLSAALPVNSQTKA